MNGEIKSKFRDRLKYFKRLFFLKRKKGNDFELDNIKNNNIENNINDDKKVIYIKKDQVVNNNLKNNYKSSVKKIYVRKKRVIGIDSSLESLKIKKNKNNNINKSINVNKEIGLKFNRENNDLTNIDSKTNTKNEKMKIIKVRNIRKKKKIIGIDDVYNSDIIDSPRLNEKNKVNKKNGYKYVNNFDKDKHIEKNDRELVLNVIVGKLENKSKKMLFKLDNLYSDYYNLLNYSEEEIDKEDCEKRLKEIEKIKKEIEFITKQFNIINDDKYLYNVLELDDSNLIDDIIKYKKLCSKLVDKKDVYENYKKIDNYDRVNVYLDKFSKKIDELKDKKEKKKEEIEKRDKDFDLFKKVVTSVDVKNERYFSMINGQVDICNKILRDVDKIYKSEEVYNKINGLGNFISSSVKYLFYLSVSPFKRLIPSIAMNTLAARDMVNIARNSLSSETIRKVNYYAKDYEYELNKYLYDINDLSNLLHSTMDDIQSFKREFDKKFGKYKNDIYEYRDVLSKIDKIEKMLNFNMEKVNNIKKDIVKGKEKNKKKLIKINRLNDN